MEPSSPKTRRTVAVLQPSYLPWLGALEQIARADVFVFYDDVQYDKNGWRNRNRIRTHGEPGWSWLTLPVKLPHAFAPIGEIQVDARAPWGRKHRRAIELAYASASHRAELERFLPLFASQTTSLVEIAMASTRALAGALGLAPEFLRSSELGIGGDRNVRLLEICKALGATDYYSGKAAEDYLDLTLFERAGIRVAFQEFVHPSYPQCHQPFISHLSALDALLCIGPEQTRTLVETKVAA
ncbi:MAG: WbqC family protein [Vulcanimicrobiaceae bacterium]